MSTPSILTNENEMVFKKGGSFAFPIFYDYYERAVASVWRHQEVAMDADIRDWQFNSTPQERQVIAGILKGFVASELGIGCYWGTKVCQIFPRPEVQAMAKAFSLFEVIHSAAYSYLNDCLGLDEYEEFVNDPIACSKVETFFNSYSDLVSLAVFSGGGEGVSLFSSFAVLLSFSRDGRYKGLAQIISWSAIDEASHADGGSLLFRELVKEVGLSKSDREAIYEGFKLIIDKEFAFIDHIFDHAEISSIDKEELKCYILNRANERLLILGLDQIFNLSNEQLSKAKSLASWFDPMTKGESSSDFFAHQKSGDSYVAKPTQDYMGVDMSSIDLESHFQEV